MHPSLPHSLWDPPAAASSKMPPNQPLKADQAKKPRHRHAPHQLAALNELYDKTEHPSLEERTALAERLGMETKTVNSWFQNKRASSKKRHKAPLTQCELPPISALIASVSAPPSTHLSHQIEYDELSEDEYLSPQPASAVHSSQQHTLFYAAEPQQKEMFESEGSVPRKARSRPSAEQTEELKKFYELKAHPTKEEREALGVKIGMRYQSVTNWFQNQRSIAKKREESAAAKAASSSQSSSRAYSPFPLPPSSSVAHPSLGVPPLTSHPSLSALFHNIPRARRSPSAAPSVSSRPSRPSSPRASPYPVHQPSVDAAHRRPRRTRPEPWQLEALKKLFNRTKTPSIEDRQRLAAEIGMDVGKVTNWFRNLRQSDRKRARRNGSASADEMDEDADTTMDVDEDDSTNASFSRTATPSATSTSGVEYVKMDVADEKSHHHIRPHQPRSIYARAPLAHSQSELASDEELPEAVTPSPESSPPPPTVASTSSLALPLAHPHARETKASIDRYALEYAQYENEKIAQTAQPELEATGVKMEDALLLLSFHHGTVVH
ncbi:homeobox-domain-containing protein [Dichomitus squalens]|uniref:Homeobox-domain-containing protein n=1 Tax=Dichomitus squalens TaxID=114155 RepID=A0A4Q9Q6M4_9APHY|nr:homeobox-domain-containing protein [Dichomitus squalens]